MKIRLAPKILSALLLATAMEALGRVLIRLTKDGEPPRYLCFGTNCWYLSDRREQAYSFTTRNERRVVHRVLHANELILAFKQDGWSAALVEVSLRRTTA